MRKAERVGDNHPARSKQGIRKHIWRYLGDNNLVLFPRPVYNQIPNFKGANIAAQRLKHLEAFKTAKTVLVSPNKPLEFARIVALEEGKKLIAPLPKYQASLLTQVQVPEGSSKNVIRRAVTRRGLKEGNPVDLNSDLKIDLMIIGSVAVTRNGLHIGKGHGYSDLEFAIIQHMKALNQNALIATLVHESQVVDGCVVPPMLFGPHDVPVDIVITPTETIFVSERPPRPSGILWTLISQRQIDNMPTLKQIKEEEETAGKVIELKETKTDLETLGKVRIPRVRFRKPIVDRKSVPNVGDGDAIKSRRNRRIDRNHRTSKNQDNGVSDGKRQRNRNLYKGKRIRKVRLENKFSVWLGNIAKTDRVRDIKSAVAARGVKPCDITWKGVKGFCYLHFALNPEGEDPLGMDSVIESLSGIRVGGNDEGEGAVSGKPHVLNVQPAKTSRVGRNDASAV